MKLVGYYVQYMYVYKKTVLCQSVNAYTTCALNTRVSKDTEILLQQLTNMLRQKIYTYT